MMFYYKRGNTYIATATQEPSETEVTKEEYDAIRKIIADCPTAPDGFGYRLNTDMTWELYKLPSNEDAELTADEALDIILGGAV